MSAQVPGRGHPNHRDWLLVDASQPGFADGVLEGLGEIFRTTAGRALLRGVYVSGRCVRIERHPPTPSPNASVRPADLQAATAAGQPTGDSMPDGEPRLGTGTGSDSLIWFDAVHWPNPTVPAWLTADVLLFALLVEAARHVQGAARPLEFANTGAAEAAGDALVQYLQERGVALHAMAALQALPGVNSTAS